MGNPCPEHLSPLPLRTLSEQKALWGARVRNRPVVSLFQLQVQPRYSGSPTRAHACGTDLLCPFSTASATALLGEPHTRARVRNRPAVSLSTASATALLGEPHTRARVRNRPAVSLFSTASVGNPSRNVNKARDVVPAGDDCLRRV